MLSSLKELSPGCLSLMKTKLSHFNQYINFSLNLPWSNISEIFPSPAYARVQMAFAQHCGQPHCSSLKQKPRFCSCTVTGENSFWTGLHFNDAGRAHLSPRVWDSSCTIETLENVLGGAFLRHDTEREKYCNGEQQQWRLIHLPNSVFAFAPLFLA